MTSLMSEIQLLIRRLSYEARMNAPLSLIVLSMLSFPFLKELDPGLRDLNWIKYIIPSCIIIFSSSIALFGYLQKARSSVTTSGHEGGGVRTEFTDSSQQALLNIERPIDPDQMRRLHLSRVRRMSDGMIARLKDELFSLSRRANANLSVGAVICVSGFAILGYFVVFTFQIDGTSRDAIQFGMRLSLVFAIEIFAYFFLSLYRALIFDIKYFQNEITNATFRVMAIEVALASADATIVRKVCDDLSKTERNSVIKKNETTRELRQIELLAEHDKSMFAAIEKFTRSIPIDRDSPPNSPSRRRAPKTQ